MFVEFNDKYVGKEFSNEYTTDMSEDAHKQSTSTSWVPLD